MICSDIKLGNGETEAVLHTYISSEKNESAPKRQAVVVFPGGAYGGLAWHEGEPVAKKFLAEGLNAFVLDYTLKEKALFPRPLLDASLAVAHVRSHAEEYNIDPDKIFVLGFSAGGHLAASLGTLWHKDIAKFSDDMPYGINKPNGMLLCYPALMPYDGHLEGMFARIWGSINPSEEYLDEYDVIRNVGENTPEAYIWHTSDDECVPVQCSLILADKMISNKILVRMHIYQHGRHGLGLGNNEGSGGEGDFKDISGWIDEAVHWIKHIDE